MKKDNECLVKDILQYVGFTLSLDNNQLSFKSSKGQITYPLYHHAPKLSETYKTYNETGVIRYDRILNVILKNIVYFNIIEDETTFKGKTIANPLYNMSYEEARIFLDLNK